MQEIIDQEFSYAVVDVADNSTTVVSNGARLRGIRINTSLSAHALPIKDGATTVITIPASSVAGAWIECGDMRFVNSLIVDPDDAATGSITVVYR